MKILPAYARVWFERFSVYPIFGLGWRLLVASLLIMVLLMVVTSPIAQRYENVKREYLLVRQKAIEASTAVEIGKAFKTALSHLPKAEARLQQKVGQAQLVSQLSRLTRRTGVSIISQSFQGAEKNGDVTTLHYKITVSGRYAAVRKMIGGISRLPAWTVITAMQINRSPKGSLVQAKFSLQTIYRTSVKNREPG